ncbi:MAG: cyclic nucleotide-binding domain-containing protein [Deltaproteobacteria bacterium]|nr:cyclic nucleotide-binding domain-containing protein [Deltaproteobacteria bacterium]
MEPGEAFGKYELLAPIASGGMAEVWLARSSSIGGFEKRLAIKRMRPEYSGNAQFVSMFIDEAKLTVALNHPNIVQVFDFGQVNDDYFMAMEFVDGVDLALLARRLRKTRRALPVSMALRIMHDVFAGLAYAHNIPTSVPTEVGIIHRDISPQNVLVSFEGHVKVSDFGIARAATSCDRAEGGWVFGKLAYVSPEQLAGANLDVRTDLWSAGVIFHELLTNQRLFSRTNDDDTREAVEMAPITAPSRANAEVPPEVDEIVLGLLARDRSERHADARAIAEALGGILGRRFPDASAFQLKETVSAAWDNQVPQIRPVSTPATLASVTLNDSTAIDPGVDPQISELREQFERVPSLWTLIDLGRRHRAIGDADLSSTWFKVAAAKFAQHGFLVQAATIYRELMDNAGSSKTGDANKASDTRELEAEIKRLRVLRGLPDDALWDALRDGNRIEDLAKCQAILVPTPPRAKDGDADSPRVFTSSPIMGSLDAEALVAFVKAITLRRFDTGQTIIEEGGPGTAFYIVGRGRVVVSTADFLGRRTFLTSLSDGDCFGEQSFFSNEPRTATVEAFEPVTLIEITQQVLSQLLSLHPAIEASLQLFYKERVAQNILLKSQVFGNLSTRARQEFAQRFLFRTCAPGEVIVRQGEIGDEFYAIKSGEMLVTARPLDAPSHTDDPPQNHNNAANAENNDHAQNTGHAENAGHNAAEVVLAHLKAGDVFGETAAIEGTPRTATVRAATASELLFMSGAELSALLAENSEVRELLGAKIAARTHHRLRAVGDDDAQGSR